MHTRCPPESWSKYFFVHFQTFFVDFRREISEKGLKWKKNWKRLKKSISTSFRVHAALESWSKYTTNKMMCGINTFFFIYITTNSVVQILPDRNTSSFSALASSCSAQPFGAMTWPFSTWVWPPRTPSPSSPFSWTPPRGEPNLDCHASDVTSDVIRRLRSSWWSLWTASRWSSCLRRGPEAGSCSRQSAWWLAEIKKKHFFGW